MIFDMSRIKNYIGNKDEDLSTVKYFINIYHYFTPI